MIIILITPIIIIIIIMIIINNAFISILPISPRCSRRAHISPEEDWNFLGKNCRMFWYYKNKIRRDIFEEKGISE